MKTDFIVIGSGLAGLTSALVLKEHGSVLLISKSQLNHCATNLAQGGIAAVVEEEDNFESHIKDTLVAGAFHNNKKAVEYMVKHAPSAIDWLVSCGVHFDRRNGAFSLKKEAAHSYRRIVSATDLTGREIERALIGRVRESNNIEIRENAFVIDLLTDGKTCLGIQLVDKISLSRRFVKASDKNYSPPIINIFSRAVILATGGLGQIYQWTTNPYVSTGDGIAMAYRAGAKLKDMEFIQFHPTALKQGKSPLFLLSEALRGEGAYLIKIKNQKSKLPHPGPLLLREGRVRSSLGERFMGDYDERMELAPRDIVARAIFREQQKGCEIYLDIRHKGKNFLTRRFPNIYKELKKRGFDLEKDLIPVTPAAHYSCGGVVTDLYGRTNIKNLYAFGEVACTGVHGANRLASNSLLESVVFPLQVLVSPRGSCRSRIPDFASKSLHFVGLKASEATSGRPSLASPAVDSVLLRYIRKNLQHLMWEKVGIVRTREGLLEAEGKIEELEKELLTLKTISIESLELKNMLQVALSIVNSAINRPKSLGAHFMVYSKP